MSSLAQKEEERRAKYEARLAEFEATLTPEEREDFAPLDYYERQAQIDKMRNERDARLADLDLAAIVLPEITDAEIIEIKKRIDRGEWTTRERELWDARIRRRYEEQSLLAIPTSLFEGCKVPLRDWWVDDLIPHRTVTILNGDGGVGKTILSLMLGSASPTSTRWLGLGTKPGPVVYLGAEDERDELHRRLDDIREHLGVSWAALKDLHIIPRAGEDALLATYLKGPGKNGLEKTHLFDQLVAIVKRIKPVGVILDTAADIFGGDEINRQQVRQFIGILRGLAQRCDTAVVMLAHPSLEGMRSGTGTSGSTAWNNSVRSRLYLTTGEQGDSANVRVLTTKKLNYGPVGGEMRLIWQKGVFVPESEAVSRGSAPLVEAKFLAMLDAYAKDNRNVSANKGPTFAPAIFAGDKRCKGFSRDMLRHAMDSLLEKGEITNETFGPASKPRTRLARAVEEDAL